LWTKGNEFHVRARQVGKGFRELAFRLVGSAVQGLLLGTEQRNPHVQVPAGLKFFDRMCMKIANLVRPVQEVFP